MLNILKSAPAITTLGGIASFIGYQYYSQASLKVDKTLYRTIEDNDATSVSKLTKNRPDILNQKIRIATQGVFFGCEESEGTELDLAFSKDSLDAAQVLIENGSRFEDVKLGDPSLALKIAARSGHTGLIKAIQQKYPKTFTAINCNDALYATIVTNTDQLCKNVAAMALLIELGADPNYLNKNGHTFYSRLEDKGLDFIKLRVQVSEIRTAVKAKLKL